MENWLEIAVGAFLLGMVLYGHYRGAIRQAVSMLALVITLVVVNLVMPYAASFVKEKTPVHDWINKSVSEAFHIDELSDSPSVSQLPAAQRQAIENMKLPEEMKSLLIENNNHEVYQMLGVDIFAEYVGNYLSSMIINMMGFVILFILVYIALHVLAGVLDLMAKLPILSGMNQLAGAFLGGLQGLFYLWIAALVITACSGMSWASYILGQIEASSWLSFLYHYNIISRIAIEIIKGIL